MGHGSPALWASFLRIFSSIRPSILNLWYAREGHTDGQTDDGHQRLMPSCMGMGIIRFTHSYITNDLTLFTVIWTIVNTGLFVVLFFCQFRGDSLAYATRES